MSHQWTMEDFESIYARFKSSGLSVIDFCSNECIRPKRFYEWRSKLLRKGGFIPVKVNSKGQVSLPHKGDHPNRQTCHHYDLSALSLME